MIDERRDYLSNVILTLIAKKLVRKGCESYLTFIIDFAPTKLSVSDIQTVRNFPNVFTDELSSVPPTWEVEFGIDLLPGTVLVSIALNHMAPK